MKSVRSNLCEPSCPCLSSLYRKQPLLLTFLSLQARRTKKSEVTHTLQVFAQKKSVAGNFIEQRFELRQVGAQVESLIMILKSQGWYSSQVGARRK